MLIEAIRIKGFRCFKDAKINLSNKNLILGANDIGKSNLVYALRILFDKNLSFRDLELTNSDYYAYESTDEIEITVKVTDMTEDCLVAGFIGDIKNNTTFIRYSKSKAQPHSIATGPTLDTLEEKNGRFYLKFLNMEYVDSTRNLESFIKKEKNNLIDYTKSYRSSELIESDEELISNIEENLGKINTDVDDVSYIKKSLDTINDEMENLSINNQDKKLRFSSISSDAEQLIDNVELVYETDDKKLTLGGDGRSNQIYLSTWISKQKELQNEKSVTFYALEEPEAHLHPQQQVKLASYIFENLTQQILITSHSPSIANQANPGNIIRLYSKDRKSTIAANGGINSELVHYFNEFSHRRNLINSQLFFLNSVLLVEGISEVIFYKTLALAKEFDIEQYNTEIISVEGVGFEPYAKICQSLNIPFAIRSDNDVFKVPKSDNKNYFAGINRFINLVDELGYQLDFKGYNTITIDEIKESLKFTGEEYPDKLINGYPIANLLINLEEYNLFLATKDLEYDLLQTPLVDSLKEYYQKENLKSLYKEMSKKKGQNMFYFTEKYYNEFSKVDDGISIYSPLKSLKELSKGEVNE